MRILKIDILFLAAFLLAAAFRLDLSAADTVPLERPDSSTGVTANAKTDEDAGLKTPNPESIRLRTMDRNIVEIGSDAVIKENENTPEAVIIFGSVIVNGRVDRDLVVVGGNAVINGQIGGNVVVVLGSAEFGPKSEVHGETTVIGGRLRSEPGARLRHAPFNLSLGLGWLSFGWFKDWLFKGLFWARPMVPQLGWMWSITGVFFIFYGLIALILPKPIQACVASLETKPLVSSLVGLLAFVFISPFSLLLVASVAGLLVVPFLVCGLFAGVLIGKVALYQYVGKQVAGQLGIPALSTPLIALTVGMAVFCLFYIIPILGLIVWGLALPLGLGSVLLALMSAFVKETAPKNNPAVPPRNYSQAAGDPPIELSPATRMDAALLPRAGFWIRFFATVIDLILVALTIPLLHGAWPFLWAFYHFAMWSWKGTTIGGIVFGLNVVRLDGKPLDVSIALVRCLGACLSMVPFCLGYFWVGWDKERQSWHDKIAGTTIVKIPKGVSLI